MKLDAMSSFDDDANVNRDLIAQSNVTHLAIDSERSITVQKHGTSIFQTSNYSFVGMPRISHCRIESSARGEEEQINISENRLI